MTGTEEEQAALVAASNNVILSDSDSDLSFCSDDSGDGGEVADESKSTSTSSGGKGVKSEVTPRKAKGRGPLMLPPSHSSTSLSSDLSLEDDLEKMSVTVQLDKSSDESVVL